MEWELSYCKFVEMNKEVKLRHPSGSGMAETLWKTRGPKTEVTRTMSNPTR